MEIAHFALTFTALRWSCGQDLYGAENEVLLQGIVALKGARAERAPGSWLPGHAMGPCSYPFSSGRSDPG